MSIWFRRLRIVEQCISGKNNDFQGDIVHQSNWKIIVEFDRTRVDVDHWIDLSEDPDSSRGMIENNHQHNWSRSDWYNQPEEEQIRCHLKTTSNYCPSSWHYYYSCSDFHDVSSFDSSSIFSAQRSFCPFWSSFSLPSDHWCSLNEESIASMFSLPLCFYAADSIDHADVLSKVLPVYFRSFEDVVDPQLTEQDSFSSSSIISLDRVHDRIDHRERLQHRICDKVREDLWWLRSIPNRI